MEMTGNCGLPVVQCSGKILPVNSVEGQSPPGPQASSSRFLSAAFLEKLACPICKGRLQVAQGLCCAACGRIYQLAPFPIFLEETWAGDPAKKDAQQQYTAVDASLEQAGKAPFASFLNYGYLPSNNRRHARMEPPPHALNRNSVRLLYEVIGSIELGGEDILEVGCGRGGNLATVVEQFAPRLAIGLDITRASIEHCHRVHALENLWCCNGDAENLPFGNKTFGAVINIESSHSYPHVRQFFSEASRVLRPGGHFLYSDMIRAEAVLPGIEFLAGVGFKLVREENITENVLRSCDQIASRRKKAYAGYTSPVKLDEFLATPGSPTYELLRSGAVKYLSLAFLKV